MTGTITVDKDEYFSLRALASWHDAMAQQKGASQEFHAAMARLLRQLLTRVYVEAANLSELT